MAQKMLILGLVGALAGTLRVAVAAPTPAPAATKAASAANLPQPCVKLNLTDSSLPAAVRLIVDQTGCRVRVSPTLLAVNHPIHLQTVGSEPLETVIRRLCQPFQARYRLEMMGGQWVVTMLAGDELFPGEVLPTATPEATAIATATATPQALAVPTVETAALPSPQPTLAATSLPAGIPTFMPGFDGPEPSHHNPVPTRIPAATSQPHPPTPTAAKTPARPSPPVLPVRTQTIFTPTVADTPLPASIRSPSAQPSASPGSNPPATLRNPLSTRVRLAGGEQSLGRYLEQVTSAAGLKLTLDKEILSDTVLNIQAEATVGDVLDHLAAVAGLRWRLEGQTVLVSPAN